MICRALALVALAALSGCGDSSAQATGDVLTWVLPTQRTDGTPIAPATINSVNIQWGNSASGPFNVGSATAAGTATTLTVPRAAGAGTVCYVATVTDSNGLISAPTPAACKTILAAPNTVSSLAVK